MKHLSIFRHAKAERAGAFATDYERTLTARGHKDTDNMGDLLKGIEPPIDWIVSSPSQRTRDTANMLIDKLNFNDAVIWLDAIYEADAQTLLTVLAQAPEGKEHVLIVGHNPGMEALVSGLAVGATSRLAIRMPTAGLAYLTLEIFQWSQIRWGSGTLHCLLPPKFLRGK